jgi:hypothetical protein
MKNASKFYKIQLNKSYCEYQDKTTNIIREKSRKNKYTYNKYSENEFMTQTNETCMIADQIRTLKAGINRCK